MDSRLTSYQNADGDEIQIFSDYALQRAIDRAIARKDPSKPYVVVAHVDNEGGVMKASLSAFVKIGDDWSIMAVCFKAAKTPISYGAEVVWTP